MPRTKRARTVWTIPRPDGVTVPKWALPLIVAGAGIVGAWYLYRDRVERHEHQITQLEARVDVLEREAMVRGDDHMSLLRIESDLQKIKVRLRIED